MVWKHHGEKGIHAARGRSELTLRVKEMQKEAEQSGVGHGVGEPENSHSERAAMDWGLSRMQEREVQGLGKKQPGRGLLWSFLLDPNILFSEPQVAPQC